MYRQNAGALTALMDRLAPGLLADVIELGSPCAMLDAREAVERGEIVGMLADRGGAPAGEGPAVRAVTVLQTNGDVQHLIIVTRP